jgi:hypothetical protein
VFFYTRVEVFDVAAECAALAALPAQGGCAASCAMAAASDARAWCARAEGGVDAAGWPVGGAGESAAALRLHVWLAEAAPAPGEGGARWRPGATLAPALTPLFRAAAHVLDVSLAPPRRLAYGAVVEPALLAPVPAPGGGAAFLAPAWALPMALPLNDWTWLREGPTEALTAYAVDSDGGGSGGGGGGAPAPRAGELPFGALPSGADGEEVGGGGGDAGCRCEPAPDAAEPLFGAPAGAAVGRDGDGSLGRSLAALAADAARWARRAWAPAPVTPCAPENLVRCHCGDGEGGGLRQQQRRQQQRALCLTHAGAWAFHSVLLRPPPSLAPQFLERSSGGNASAWPPGGSTLRVFGWGAIHLVNGAVADSGGGDAWEAAAAAEVAAQLREALGLPPPAGDPVAFSAEDLRFLDTRWALVHRTMAREALRGVCAQAGNARGTLPLRVPAHVQGQVREGLRELRAADALCEKEGGAAGSTGALRALRRARLHAEAAAADAYATRTAALSAMHGWAIYAPWWAAAAMPLLLALRDAARTGFVS